MVKIKKKNVKTGFFFYESKNNEKRMHDLNPTHIVQSLSTSRQHHTNKFDWKTN